MGKYNNKINEDEFNNIKQIIKLMKQGIKKYELNLELINSLTPQIIHLFQYYY
jgi:hypothetical protein